jgi:hypothetical protein
MKALRDAVLAGATLVLLLYVAMTAAKSMADTQPAVAMVSRLDCKPGAASKADACNTPMQVARRDR